MLKKVLKYIWLLLLVIPLNVKALSSTYQDNVAKITNTEVSDTKINIYFFRGEGCPHRAEEEQWLDNLKKQYQDEIDVYDFEVWHNETNANYLDKVKANFNFQVTGVPFTVIGDSYYLGFSDTNKSKIESKLNEYLDKDSTTNEVKIPILGNINMQNISIPLVAIILGFIDGFNPCAMWVLLFLINMLFKIENKHKRWLLGIAFLISSALIYFLSMLGINLVLSVVTISYLKIIIALFILGAGLFNLKKYFK